MKHGTPAGHWLISWVVVIAATVFYWAFDRPFSTPKYLVLFILCVLLSQWGRFVHPLKLSWWLLLAWPLVTVFWVTDLRLFAGALMPFGVLAMASMLDLENEQREALARGMAWSVVPVTVYLLIQRLGWDPLTLEQGAMAGGFFGNTNFSAHYLILVLTTGGIRRRWLIWVVLAGLIVTESRGGLLAFTIWVLWVYRSHMAGLPAWFKWSLVGFLGCLGAFLVHQFSSDLNRGWSYLTNPSAYANHVQAHLDVIRAAEARGQDPEAWVGVDPWLYGKRRSLMVRVPLAANASVLCQDRPLTGFGLGQFHVFYPRRAQAIFPDIHLSDRFRARSAHNLLLDGAVTLGLPWMVLLGFCLLGLWRRGGAPWRMALVLQLGLALVSLNFLNPLIPTLLLLLGPSPAQPGAAFSQPVKLLTRGFFVLAGLLLLFGSLVDAQAVTAEPKPKAFFPAHYAANAYQEGDLTTALGFQIKAFEQDPYGPETIYNLGVIAHYLGQTEDRPELQELALQAWQVNRLMHPFYEPAEQRWREAAGTSADLAGTQEAAHARLRRTLGEIQNQLSFDL